MLLNLLHFLSYISIFYQSWFENLLFVFFLQKLSCAFSPVAMVGNGNNDVSRGSNGGNMFMNDYTGHRSERGIEVLIDEDIVTTVWRLNQNDKSLIASLWRNCREENMQNARNALALRWGLLRMESTKSVVVVLSTPSEWRHLYMTS